MTSALAKLPSESKLASITQQVESLALATQEDLNHASKVVQKIAALYRGIDEQRTAENRPHLDAKAVVDSKYQPTIKKLQGLERKLKQKIDAVLAKQREAEHRERMQLQAEINDAGGDADASDALVPIRERFELPPELRESSELTFEITNEAVVPAQYKRTCGELVQAEIDRTKGACKIPGIKVVRTFKTARKGVVTR